MKVYLKQPVTVERIDESGYGLIDKYEIYSLSGGIWHPHDEVGHSMLCSGHIEWGDWMATGADGSHWIIPNDLYEQQYAKLPVIPKMVAEAIELLRPNATLFDGMDAILSGVGTLPDWVKSNKDRFARAWLGGYTVEADK